MNQRELSELKNKYNKIIKHIFLLRMNKTVDASELLRQDKIESNQTH